MVNKLVSKVVARYIMVAMVFYAVSRAVPMDIHCFDRDFMVAMVF